MRHYPGIAVVGVGVGDVVVPARATDMLGAGWRQQLPLLLLFILLLLLLLLLLVLLPHEKATVAVALSRSNECGSISYSSSRPAQRKPEEDVTPGHEPNDIPSTQVFACACACVKIGCELNCTLGVVAAFQD